MIQITAVIVDEGTCSSDVHCVFRSSSTFFGSNYSLYFVKIATAHAFLNSLVFHFSKYVKNVKMAKHCIKALSEIKRRYIAGLSSLGRDSSLPLTFCL